MEAREPPLYLEWPTLVHASGKIKFVAYHNDRF
jgi:hypothetical protein